MRFRYEVEPQSRCDLTEIHLTMVDNVAHIHSTMVYVDNVDDDAWVLIINCFYQSFNPRRFIPPCPLFSECFLPFASFVLFCRSEESVMEMVQSISL